MIIFTFNSTKSGYFISPNLLHCIMKKQDDLTKPAVSDADIRLFREAIGNVVPNSSAQTVNSKTPPSPIPKQRIADEKQVMKALMDEDPEQSDLEYGAELNFYRAGVQHQVLRKLRRGEYKIEDELDLHGMTVAQAKIALRKFINNKRDGRRHCIRIIHGKGHGSKDNIPVLKNKINIWLKQFEETLAFCSAKVSDGGTGAVYVLLKNKNYHKSGE